MSSSLALISAADRTPAGYCDSLGALVMKVEGEIFGPKGRE